MNIEYALNESMPFEKIELGASFEHTGNVYIKLKSFYMSNGHTYNAVNLNESELVYIPAEMTVRPVRATVRIS